MFKLLAWTAAIGVGVWANAAYAATGPNYAGTPKSDLVQITNATNTAAVTIVTGSANGSRRWTLNCSNTDTNPYTMKVTKVRSATSYLLSTVTITASAGDLTGTSRVQVFSATNFPGAPTDSDGNTFLTLESGDTLQIAITAQITSGKIISCDSSGFDF